MKRSLLLAFAVAVAVVAPAQAHEAWHEATGTITALSSSSISVRGEVVPPAAQPTPDVLTCAITSRSPSVSSVEAGDRVYIHCDWLDGRQTLLTIVPQSVLRKFSGKLTAVSRTSITVRTKSGRATCAVTAKTRPKLRGMAVGHPVVAVCRKTGTKLVLVDLKHGGGHAGH